MIKKDKNKIKSKTRSKILVLGLIFISLVGVFGLVATRQVSAIWSGTSADLGTCTSTMGGNKVTTHNTQRGDCGVDMGMTFTQNTSQPWNTASTGTCVINGQTLTNVSYATCILDNPSSPGQFTATPPPPGLSIVPVPGSICIVTRGKTSATIFNITTFGNVDPFEEGCNKYKGVFNNPTGTFTSETCTFKDTSPKTCADNGGDYSATGKIEQQDLTSYTLLAPLPDTKGGQFTTFNLTDPHALGNYLNLMIAIFIGICAVLAVIMIVWGGIEYMTSELVSSKEAGKERIRDAIFGLILALGAWILLNTINPNLLKSDIQIADVAATASLGGESTQSFQPINKSVLENSFGIPCSGNDGNGNTGKAAIPGIAQKFINQTEYSKTARNTTDSSTIFVDCSSFADQVYTCAGLASPGNNSQQIFSNNAQAVDEKTFNFSTLHPGDLVGWKPGDDPKNLTDGHVAIYLGNGKIIDTQDTNNPTAIRDLSSIQSRITYVKWPK